MYAKTKLGLGSHRARLGFMAAICLPTLIIGGGCKSSMPTVPTPSMPSWTKPNWGAFGFKREPSADTLAGMGPTTTYPVSPSAGATPAPIESVAASPAGVKPQTAGQVAGIAPAETSLAATNTQPTGGTNPAAAMANGYAGPKPSYATSPPAISGGQQPGGSLASQSPVGSTPPMSVSGLPASPTPSGAPSASSYAAMGYPLPGSQPAGLPASPPSGNFAPPSTSLSQLPRGLMSGSAVPPMSAVAVPAPSGGLASSSPPVATPPSLNTDFAMPSSAVAASATSSAGFTMPGVPTSTPPAATSAKPEALTATAAPPARDTKTVTTGYTPGSTMGATSYPGFQDPNTGGADTFYR